LRTLRTLRTSGIKEKLRFKSQEMQLFIPLSTCAWKG
jgi:hypothetical protein